MSQAGCRNILMVLCLAWLSVQAVPARAQGTPHRRTVVLRLDFEGSVNEVSRDQLARRLFEGLASAGFQVFSADELVARLYASTPSLKACADEACYRQISAALQANFLATGKVEAKRRDYQIALKLIHGPTGKVLRTEEQRCDVCGIQEAGDTVNLAAAALRAGLEEVEAPAQVTVETRPSGALVEVDGQPLGFTPLTQDLVVGVHELVITKPGYDVVSRSIEVQPRAAQNINVDLQRQPAPFMSPGWRTTGWVSFGLGLAAIAGGSYLMSLQGEDTACTGSGPARMCTETYEVRWLAAGLLAGGGLAAGLGGTVLFIAPGVVQKTLVRSDPGQPAQQSAAWQVVLRSNF